MTEHHFPDIKKICALGAGTMGIGTAVDYAKEGYDVALYVREDDTRDDIYNARKRSMAADGILAVLKDMADHDLIHSNSINAIASRIKIASDLFEVASDADFVMESISEDTTDKQNIFLKLDAICPPHSLFATNTSALNPTEIASVLPEQRQKQFIVLHGFNPPHLMPLVEVAPGEKTGFATIKTATHLLESIGKRPVHLHKATPGFIVNYIQSAIIWAALQLHVEHGREAAKIDRTFKEQLGPSYEVLGPLEMAGHINSELTDIQAKTLLAMQEEQPLDTSIVGWIRNAALRASLEIVANGTASAKEVEYAFVHSLGRRYRETGPLESADMGGLHIFQSIFHTLGYLKTPSLVGDHITQSVSRGETGIKCDSKKGLYAWTPKTIADVSSRRKARLVGFLQEDLQKGQAVRPEMRLLDKGQTSIPVPAGTAQTGLSL